MILTIGKKYDKTLSVPYKFEMENNPNVQQLNIDVFIRLFCVCGGTGTEGETGRWSDGVMSRKSVMSERTREK